MDLGGKVIFFLPFSFFFKSVYLYGFGMDDLTRLYFSSLFRVLQVTGENGSI